jgi:hypothetical protein
MHPTKATLWPTAVFLMAGALAVGCSDVGDSSAPTGTPDSSSTVDGTSTDDSSSAADAAGDGATGGGMDATLESSTDDSSSPPEDTGAADSASEKDAGVPEGSSMDTGVADSAPSEAGPPDGGTGIPDATVESGAAEAGVQESGAPEAGGADAGQEASTGGGPTPCTAAPCSASGANSVQCPGSATSNGVCTATEAAIVARDIAKGNLDGTGQLKQYVSAANNGSCYTCLNAKSCLDDDQMDVGSECADAPDLAGGAAGSGVTQCLATLACVLGSDCEGPGGIAGTSAVAAQENVNLCYCGGNNAGSACNTAGAATNGACVTQEAAGFGFAFTDNMDILENFGAKTYPSGIANHIFQCAASQKCPSCQ